jgi:hypothetical protein
MMTKRLPWSGRIALLSLLPVTLLPLLFGGQRSPALVPAGRFHHPQSTFHDWTTQHVLYPHSGTMAALEAARSDPRALFRWREMEHRELAQPEAQRHSLISFLEFRRPGPGHFPIRDTSDIHADWSVSLGAGSTAAGQYPAKFTFDTTVAVTAPASCTNDFIVFPVNVNGSATQPNIVAFNNLYTGTAGGNGICNRTVTVTDAGTSAPTVYWGYNVHAIAGGGAVPTSPVLSLDGKKLAFVESAAGSAAHFHVLAYKIQDGVNTSTTTANAAQDVTKPAAITSFSATAPAAASGTATDLQLGAATTGSDTLSSPYIDYANDTAYVGNDIGVLYRIKNVFCTTASCGTAAPSLDTTWGGTGSVTVCAGKLTGPVQDFATLHIFVGCADGKIYGFTSTGAPLATASIAVGDGSATGGVVESPVVDGVNGLVYAASGTGAAPNTTHAVVVQATTSLGGPCAAGTLCVATFGAGGVFSTHSPAFNDAYFSSGTSSNWMIYEMAYSSATALTVYGTTFSGTRALTAGAATNSLNFGIHMGEFAPLTEFDNAGTDQLFFGILHAPVVNVNTLGVFHINAFPATAMGVSEGAGPTGMTIDNSSTSGQASSIYFATTGTAAQGGNMAVKLTQGALQ